jgi:RNA-directed DNA polymerase
VERYLTRKLKLVVNHAKSCVRSTDGLEFLGYPFTGYAGQMRVSPKNFDKFKQRVQELTRRSCGILLTTRLKALGYYLRGWTGYFCLVPIKNFFVVLNK